MCMRTPHLLYFMNCCVGRCDDEKMIFYILFFVANSRKIEPNADGDFIISKHLTKNEFNFLFVGDWGGATPPVFTTPIQLNVARSMMRTAKIWKPDFVFAIGDNFYNYGVMSRDSRIK